MTDETTQEFKFPSELIDLPSEGKLYPKDSPLSSGQVELKYMTAREEDILTSQNLIKKGVVIDKLLDSLILSKGVKVEDLVMGDKNAIMVAARILAYGPEYTTEITNSTTGNVSTHVFNLSQCKYKPIPSDISSNEFDITLPVSKMKIKFKLLVGKDESSIEAELQSLKKLGGNVSRELTTRLKHCILSVDGDDTQSKINVFVDNMLSRDSLFLRKELNRVSPDIDLSHEIESEGEMVKVNIPMTTTFFWPDTTA
jgi:hypothetical protein